MTTQSVRPGEAVSALFEGIQLGFGRPELRKKLIVSLLINAVAFALLVAALLWGAFGLVDWLLGDAAVADPDPGWLESAWAWVAAGLSWMLKIAAVVGSLFLAPVLFNLVASIILPAFHGPVFLTARRLAGGPAIPGEETSLAASVAIEVKRLVGFVVKSLLILPLNLIPGIGSLAYLVVQLYLAAGTLGWDLMAYHFELHGMGFEDQKAFVKREKTMVLALGGVATLLCTIPVAQIVFLTTNVAGAGIVSARLDGAAKTAV